MLLLASERGLGRRWVWFEIGASWAKSLRIIPCCIGGISRGQLPAPFSTYQALSLDEADGLKELLNTLSKFFAAPLEQTDLADAVSTLARLNEEARMLGGISPAAEEVRRRIDRVEVSASIQQGTAQWFLINAKNGSDEEVEIAEVRLESKGIRLTEPARPEKKGIWKIRPGGSLPIGWKAQPNPASTLLAMNLRAAGQFNVATELHIVLMCEVLGATKKCESKLWVLIDVHNSQIEQLAG